jgi:hypothetical protein
MQDFVTKIDILTLTIVNANVKPAPQTIRYPFFGSSGEVISPEASGASVLEVKGVRWRGRKWPSLTGR